MEVGGGETGVKKGPVGEDFLARGFVDITRSTGTLEVDAEAANELVGFLSVHVEVGVPAFPNENRIEPNPATSPAT